MKMPSHSTRNHAWSCRHRNGNAIPAPLYKLTEKSTSVVETLASLASLTQPTQTRKKGLLDAVSDSLWKHHGVLLPSSPATQQQPAASQSGCFVPE